MIERPSLLNELRLGLKQFKVVALLGARQVGKTTLARLLGEHLQISRYFDMEVESDVAALATPQITLGSLKGIVVIDEVQRMPQIFQILRPLADRVPLPARFILLGSASPDIVQGVSETLAGRCLYMAVPGLSLAEVGTQHMNALWLRGGFPDAFTASSDQASLHWRKAFIRSFLERDIPQLGFSTPPATLRRFWMMLAHYHGQIWNASEIARSMDHNYKTVQHYRDLLVGAFMLRVLTPWYTNLGKRLVRSPKVYLRDSGLLHALLDIPTMDALRSSPIYGASWEGFALEQILIAMGEDNAFYYRTQRGAELDLMLVRGGRNWGFEFKCTDAPRMTPSLKVAIEDLKLERAYVVYPGTVQYPIHERAEALPLSMIASIPAEIAKLSRKATK